MKRPEMRTQAGSTGGAEVSIANAVHLTERINSHHAAAIHHAEQVLVNARAAGELLLEAKDGCKHGEWLNWIEVNFAGTQATAWRYMRIAQKWDELETNYSHVNSLSIREALRLVRYGYSRKPYQNKTREGRA